MLKLTKEQQKTIEMQMYNKARDIDVAVYNCMVRPDFPKMLYTTALTGYQNKDGGFAHALEIDNYNVDSSMPQATEAFRLTRLAGFKSSDEDEILAATYKKLFNYLYNRLDKWEAVIPSNDKAICASWYKYTDVNRNRFGYAPTPEVVGYTLYFNDIKSPYYKKAMVKANEVIDRFLSNNEFTNEELMSFAKFVNLTKEKNLFSDKMNDLEKHLIDMANKYMAKTDFSGVCLMPIDLFEGYTSNDEVNKAIDDNLDYILSTIKSHGLWDAPFDWSGEIGEGSTAQIKWIGCITCKYLGALKKFNRIEE